MVSRYACVDAHRRHTHTSEARMYISLREKSERELCFVFFYYPFHATERPESGITELEVSNSRLSHTTLERESESETAIYAHGALGIHLFFFVMKYT